MLRLRREATGATHRNHNATLPKHMRHWPGVGIDPHMFQCVFFHVGSPAATTMRHLGQPSEAFGVCAR
eukprot:10034395-Alexandrium_andersonii.AAC.1